MQPFQAGQQVQMRKALLIFLKHVGPPLVLYVDEPEAVYKEVKQIISKASNATPKLIERFGKGPLKAVAVLDTQIAGVAMQDEAHMA